MSKRSTTFKTRTQIRESLRRREQIAKGVLNPPFSTPRRAPVPRQRDHRASASRPV